MAVTSQTVNTTYMWFSELFQLQSFFGYFLLVLGSRTKLIKFWNKLQIKFVKFFPYRCTSFQQHSNPVQQNWLRFFENFEIQCAIQGLIQLKLLGEMLLLTIDLHQNVRKNNKMTKGPSFETTCELLTWLLSLG